MADIQIIAEVVGQEGINSLIKSTQTLEGRVKTLSKAYQSGKIGPDQYNKGLSELRKTAQALYPTHQKASAVVTKLSKDYLAASKAQKEYTAAQKQEQAATRAYVQARREATEANQRFDAEQRKITQAQKEAADAARKQAQEITRLRSKYVEGYVASQKFKKEIRDLIQAKRKGIITTDQYGDAVQRLKTDFRDFQGGVVKGSNQFANYNTSVYQANQRTKRFASVGLQQAGYQVGDFIVQVQNGQSALVAFGQQGSQLAGIFGPAGAIIGALIAAGTAIAMIIKSVNQASDAIESFSDVTKGLTEEIKRSNLELFKFAQNINNIAVAKATLKLQDIQEQIGEVRSRIEEAQRQGAGGVLSAASLNTELRVLEKQRDSLQGQIDELNRIEEKHENVKGFITDIFNISESLDFSVANRGASFLEARLKGAAKAALDILQRTSDRIQRGREVGRGRGTMGGPTPEEIQRNDPRAQLAYAPMIEVGGGKGSSGGGSGGSGVDQAQEFNKAREALASLVSQYDDGVKVAQQLSKAQETVNQAVEAGVITTEQGQTAMQGYINSLDNAESPLKKIGETLKSSLGDAFMSIVDGSKSAGEAFRDMARIVLKQAFDMLVIQPILNSIFGGGGGFSLFSANGNAFEQGGKVTAYANGGVVNAPTAFQHSGGLGVMGEAGPEAIMPLKRGKNGKLGVQTEDGGQQPVVINQSFNFSANGDESVKRIIAQEAPRIANLTQKQILDQRRRGGAMKATFG